MYGTAGLTAEDVKLLTRYEGVYAEQSYGLMPIDNFTIEEIAQQIRAAGSVPLYLVLTWVNAKRRILQQV